MSRSCLQYLWKSFFFSSLSFCFCLIFLHASPFETTVKMKPFLFIFRVEPGGPLAQRRTSFCLFWNVMSCIYREQPKNVFPGSALLSEKDQVRWIHSRQLRNAVSEFHLMSNVSKCISYIDLFMWIRRISTFSSYLAVTWGFCPNDTFLFVHQSACFMNELQWTVFVSLLEEKKKKLPKDIKFKLRPSPTVLSCNQVDMTDQHVYQSAYWVGWHKMLYQMLAKDHVTEFPTSCYHLFCLSDLPSSRRFFSVFLSDVGGDTCASDWTWSNVMSGFRFYLTPNANTTWSSVLRYTSQQCRMPLGSDWGWFWDLMMSHVRDEVCEEECFVTSINT